MLSETGRVRLDAWSFFRKVTFFVFVILEILAWARLGRIQIRRPFYRLLIFLLHPEFTLRSLLIALLISSLITIMGVVVVRFIIAPLLGRWLRPTTDPSLGAFHLGAGEHVLATAPARRRVGRSWQPGSLVLTDLRLWFFPESWLSEPWSMVRKAGLKVFAEPAPIPRWLPIRDWPDRIVAEASTDHQEVLAVSDPAAVMAWFSARSTANALPLFTLH